MRAAQEPKSKSGSQKLKAAHDFYLFEFKLKIKATVPWPPPQTLKMKKYEAKPSSFRSTRVPGPPSDHKNENFFLEITMILGEK